jgi:hypothetical protein
VKCKVEGWGGLRCRVRQGRVGSYKRGGLEAKARQVVIGRREKCESGLDVYGIKRTIFVQFRV